MKVLTRLMGLAVVFALAGAAFGADAPAATKAEKTDENAAKQEAKVSIDAKDTKLTEVLDSIAKQSKEKFVVESTVKGKVTASLTDASLESALAAVCKAGKCEWRKVYISPDSKLLEQPDRFASTVRLMSGLSFPDMVLAGSSTNKIGVHCNNKESVQAAEKSATTDLGMTRVYLITNDAAVAAKAIAAEDKEKKDESSKAVTDYVDMAKKQMDMFMQMTPEDQEQVLLESMNMVDQVGPEYMSSVMRALYRTDQEGLKRMMAKGTQLLFGMSTDDRRAMMKMNMQAMQYITPDQQKILAEDAKAVAEEMKAEGKLPGQ